MKRVSEKTIQRLRDAAYRAAKYRDQFEQMLYKAQEADNWDEVCEAAGIVPDGDAGEWMC